MGSGLEVRAGLGVAGGLAVAGYVIRMRLLRARFAAVIDERNRIARDLHDSLAQYFAGIGFQLERLASRMQGQPTSASRLLSSTKQMVQRGRMESRHIIWNLRNEEVINLPLDKALEQVMAEMPFSSSVSVEVSVEGRSRALARKVQEEILHVAREAVVNAVVHGRAQVVSVHVEFEDHALTLEIADDGDGFDVDGDEASLNFGLQGMGERAERLGGHINIRSDRGVGTTVTFSIGALDGS